MTARLLLPAILALLLAVPAARADAPDRAYEKLAPIEWRWAYEGVERLERSGYFTGSPEGTFSGDRVLTRYEFAVAVERVFRGLQPRALAAGQAGSLRQELRTYTLLLDEFAPEISELGPDVEEIRRQLAALEQRVERLVKATPARPAGETLLSQSLSRPRSYGLRNRLGSSLADEILASSLRTGLPGFAGLAPVQPGLGAGLGPVQVGFNLDAPEMLDTADLPFEDPADALSYGARLSLPLGRYLVSAFYDRQGGLSDRFQLWNPYFRLGRSEGVGGAFSGTIGDRLAFLLETAAIRPEDELAHLRYFRGQASYHFGRGFSFGLGYEWFGLTGNRADFRAYTMGLGRSFGPNTRFDLLLRYFNAGPGSGTVQDDLSNSSAVTQISVRF